MTLILDIKENKGKFFMELLQSLNYVHVLKEIKNPKQSQFIEDLAEAFDDVRLHENGKKKLKSAKDLLKEI